MANDRVFIKCNGCGGWKMLLKYFPNTGSTTRDNGILKWLDAHAGCHQRAGHPDLDGDTGFELFAESGVDSLDYEKQNTTP